MWYIFILVIILCWAFLDCATITYWLYFSGLFIQDRIVNGDWNMAFCCIDAIGNCKSLRPILTIRDVENFGVQNLYELFSAIKQMTEPKNQFKFSIILETSDNLWMKSVYTDTSNSAFLFYYVGLMSYGEGKKEMVQRFGLFTEEVYNNLYEKLGGHASFFKYVWRKHNDNMQCDDAINFILEQSQIIVSAYLMHIQKKKTRKR